MTCSLSWEQVARSGALRPKLCGVSGGSARISAPAPHSSPSLPAGFAALASYGGGGTPSVHPEIPGPLPSQNSSHIRTPPSISSSVSPHMIATIPFVSQIDAFFQDPNSSSSGNPATSPSATLRYSRAFNLASSLSPKVRIHDVRVCICQIVTYRQFCITQIFPRPPRSSDFIHYRFISPYRLFYITERIQHVCLVSLGAEPLDICTRFNKPIICSGHSYPSAFFISGNASQCCQQVTCISTPPTLLCQTIYLLQTPANVALLIEFFYQPYTSSVRLCFYIVPSGFHCETACRIGHHHVF